MIELERQERSRWEYKRKRKEKKMCVDDHNKVLEVLEFELRWKFKHKLLRSRGILQALYTSIWIFRKWVIKARSEPGQRLSNNL